MRILLTNDDGYKSPGIVLLADALRKAGHRVFLVAPDKNRSGCSHSIEFLNGPIKLCPTGEDSWSCSGTPVDCVVTALLGGIPEIDVTQNKSPDLVLSGINVGANLGTDIVYSGTAAAARQGSFFGLPSVALSLVENEGKWRWDAVISYITEELKAFMAHWKPGVFVNINFPNTQKKPLSLVPSFPSMRYYNDRIETFTAPDGGTYCFAKTGVTTGCEDKSDWAEVKKGNAALSVVMARPNVI